MFHPNGPSLRELTVQALSSTERGYDLLAPKFDYTPFRTPDVVLEAVRLHLEPLAPFDNGLDLCCGTGAGMRMLRPLCRDSVVGVDFSQGMLQVGREKLADAPGTARLEWVRANALALPLAEAFDIAVCFGACGHIPRRDEPRFLSEVWRVLRPGGRFVFVSSSWPSIFSLRLWVARAFNGVMRLRNAIKSPPFIMYYLTFLLPQARTQLQQHGFETDVLPLSPDRRLEALRLVVARKPWKRQ